MADPLSIIVGTTQLIYLVSKLLSISKALSDTVYTLRDPAFIAVKADLAIEQISLARWLKYVDNQGGLDNVLKFAAPEDREMISEFYQDILRLIELAERSFDEANPQKTDRVERITSAMKWGFRGREDLQSLLRTIHKVNEALEKLVPAPPAYVDPRGYGPAPSSSSSASPAAMAGGNRNRIQFEESSTQPVVSCGSTISSRTPAIETSTKLASRQPMRIIQYLHQHGHSALQRLSNYHGGRALEPEADKLGRWGELLKGPLALDILLLEKDVQDNSLLFNDLREALIRSLVDIILIEEFVLSELVKDSFRPDLGEVLLSIVSSLAVEDAREIAANRPMVSYSFDTTEELLDKAKKKLESVVDALYQLLPTIRIIRRGAMLNREEQQQRGQQRATAVVSAQPIATEKMETEELLDRVISVVSHPIPEDQKVETDSRDASPCEPIGMKVIQLLQEYKALHAAKLLGEDKELTDRMLKEFLAGEGKSGESGKIDPQSEKWRLELRRRAENLVNELPRPAHS